MPLKLAIVGRPNVGKSTLFNRLAGKKLAIVDDQPGVTRDRRFGTGRIGDLELELIDTAGFEDVTDESLEARMRAQTELAIEECDVCLFLIDAREGVVPLDRVFGEILRRTDKPVVLAANKAEGKAGDAGALEGFDLGLGEPISISAEHGEGMAELYAALAIYEPDDNDEADLGDNPVKIAIVGRPNAGKSTLVNRLIGEERLLVGPEAGITRDAIPVDWEWDGKKVRLVDTAGLRRKAKVNEKLERLSTMDTIRAITFAEVVILVMDATHPFETQDLQIADLIEREGRGLVFVLAKWDLVEDPQATLKAFIEHAERMLPQVRGAPVIALSGETGRGVERLMPAVFKLHRDWSTKLKTRDLNDWLQLAMQRHPPPSVNGRRIKPKYMAQTKARPPTFVLFSSRADDMPEQYRRYLVNSMRESFDMPGVPLRITLKSGKNPYGEGGDKAGPASHREGDAYKPARKSGLAKSLAKQAEARSDRKMPGQPGFKTKGTTTASIKPKSVKTGKAGVAKKGGVVRGGAARAGVAKGGRSTSRRTPGTR
ncbi:ribosome biogenesis GTPase Der [soil metagenome]